MGRGAGRSESLRWKKHTLLFHCSGALEEHGSSSSGLNKDANFIPSSAVNIKRRYGICRRTVTSLERELVCLCSCYSGPRRRNFKWPRLCLAGVGGRLWFSLPLPGREVALARVIYVTIINCLQWAFLLPVEENTLSSSFFTKKEWNK